MAFWNEIGNRVRLAVSGVPGSTRNSKKRCGFTSRPARMNWNRPASPGPMPCGKRAREFGSTLRSREEAPLRVANPLAGDLGSDLRYAGAAHAAQSCPDAGGGGLAGSGIGAKHHHIQHRKEALFSQPSCRDPQSLVEISVGGNTWIPMSQYRFLEDAHAFDGLAGMNIQMVVNWRDGNRSYRLAGTHRHRQLLRGDGNSSCHGRPIERGESDVAVITHGFWTRRLGGDPSVVGRTLALDGKPYTVVGVLPRDHRMLAGFGFTPDLYLTKDPGEVMLYARLPRG